MKIKTNPLYIQSKNMHLGGSMRWFKHFSDNHRGQSVQSLLDELGYFGPFFYYTVYELCTEKLHQHEESFISEDDCTFRFHRRVVGSACRAKPTSVVRGLDAGQSCGLWSYKTDGDFIEIKMPILLNLLDRDHKKPRLKREQNARRMRVEEDKEQNRIEEELEKEKNIKKETADPACVRSLKLFEKPDESFSDSDLKFDFSESEKVALKNKHDAVANNNALDAIYAEYPRKEGKAKGLLNAAALIKTSSDLEAFATAVRNYAAINKDTDPKFIKTFASFVGTKRAQVWRDYINIETKSAYKMSDFVVKE